MNFVRWGTFGDRHQVSGRKEQGEHTDGAHIVQKVFGIGPGIQVCISCAAIALSDRKRSMSDTGNIEKMTLYTLATMFDSLAERYSVAISTDTKVNESIHLRRGLSP